MARPIQNVSSNILGPGIDEAKLLEAVARSGYPLQTVVGAHLLGRDYALQEEWPFVDTDTGETRTLDIFAAQRLTPNVISTESGDLSLFLILLVECKQSELPFVAFEAVSPPKDATFPLIFGLPRSDVGLVLDTPEREMISLSAQRFLGLDTHALVQTPPVASSISAVHRKKSAGFELSGDQAFRNIIFPITKALSHFRGQTEHQPSSGYDGDEKDTVVARVVLPIVVLDAPLLLAGVPTDKPTLDPTPWIRIVRRHTRPGREVWRIPKPTMVDFVHKEFFDDYITHFVHEWTEDFRERVTRHYATMMRYPFIPGLSMADALPNDPYNHALPEPPDWETTPNA